MSKGDVSLESLTAEEHDRFKMLCTIHGETESDALVKFARFFLVIHQNPGLHIALEMLKDKYQVDDHINVEPLLKLVIQ